MCDSDVTYVMESECGVSDCENSEDDNDCGDASVRLAYNACASVCYD